MDMRGIWEKLRSQTLDYKSYIFYKMWLKEFVFRLDKFEKVESDVRKIEG